GLGPLERMSFLKSSEPAAELIREARAGAPRAKVASFHCYYRGLPFFLGEPVVLLGDRNELKVEAFAERPELYMPDLVFWTDEVAWIEDCWTRSFLATEAPVLVVLPNGRRREWFLALCAKAGVRAEPR